MFHDGFGVKHGEHLPGLAVHEYLVEYSQHWDIDHRIEFRSKVLNAERVQDEKLDGWLLTVQTPDKEYALFTSKLIVTTGLTSQPQPMHMQGEGAFNADSVNTADLADKAPQVLEKPGTKRITILGGSKSAYDAVYMFASAGKEVDWVVRRSGHGPAWMSVTHIVLGLLGKFWAESLVTRRILAWMSPCLWGGLDGSGWWRSFLHQTWLGRKIVNGFWWKMGSDTLDQSGFNSHPSIKPLKPDCSIFEQAISFSILNYHTDILDYVRSGQVRVHRQDLSHLSDHAVHLADGTRLESDAFFASTGWLFGPAVHFKDASLHSDLDIPSTKYSNAQKAFWHDLDTKADREIFRQ